MEDEKFTEEEARYLSGLIDVDIRKRFESSFSREIGVREKIKNKVWNLTLEFNNSLISLENNQKATLPPAQDKPEAS